MVKCFEVYSKIAGIHVQPVECHFASVLKLQHLNNQLDQVPSILMILSNIWMLIYYVCNQEHLDQLTDLFI